MPAVVFSTTCDLKPGIDPDGFSSGWIDDPTWSVWIGRANQGLRFRVKARDIYGNETEWSEWRPMILLNSPVRQ